MKLEAWKDASSGDRRFPSFNDVACVLAFTILAWGRRASCGSFRQLIPVEGAHDLAGVYPSYRKVDLVTSLVNVTVDRTVCK